MPDAPPPLPIPTEPPEHREPSLTKAPPEGKRFPCAQCGAKVEFNARSRSLKCPYCGHETKISGPDDDEDVVERDYDEYLRRVEAGRGAVIEGRSSQIRCTGCGAMVLLEDKVVTENCPFCGTHLENKPESAESMIPPESIIPFSIDLRAAREAFTQWLHGLWFAPTKLKLLALLGKLNGVYIPYWTYDAMTYTRYSGMRGDNYTVTESYTERDAQGNLVTKTRTVTRIRWTPVSGEVQHFFDDVLVCGSKSVPEHLVYKMEPWPLQELEPFKSEFLAGLKTERYALGLKEGLVVAKKLMEPTIIALIRRDIGGDHQQISVKHTRYLAITFKHCLLPVWVANYRYQDKLFQILINGRTGKVAGERPWSFWKIFSLVAAILIVIGVIIALVMAAQGAKGAEVSGWPQSPVHHQQSGTHSAPSPRRRSGRKPIPYPIRSIASESDSVVQPAGPPLPELEHRGQDPIPAPVWRPRHVPVRVTRHQLGMPSFKERPIGDDRALGRRPRSQSAP